MASENSKVLNLTNNSGKDIVIALAVSAGETPGSNAVVAPNGEIEILKTAGGSTLIRDNSSDTITLDHNDISNGNAYLQDYDLQICDSAWLYPFINLPVGQQASNGSAAYARQTITNANGAGMSQAATFYQTIAVYPDSQLATDYRTAIEATKEATLVKADGSPDSANAAASAIEGVVNAFFQGTQEYKDVTLADMVTLNNYYNNFPAVWAQYKDEMTYYLYGSDGETAVFAGLLSLQKNGTMDATKAAGGYTCAFVPAVDPADTGKTDVDEAKAVPLTYADGLFVDDAQASAPNIALKGAFLLERLFTEDAADNTETDGTATNNTIIVVMSGTAKNINCIGFDTDQSQFAPVRQRLTATTAGSDPMQQYWDTLTDPKNQLELILSLLTLASAILIIPSVSLAAYNVYRAIKAKARLQEALDKKIVETKWSDMTLSQQDALREKCFRWFGPNKNIYVEPNPNNIEEYYKVLRYDIYTNKLLTALEEQDACCETLLKDASLMDATDRAQLNSVSHSIEQSRTSLSNCKRTDLDTNLPTELKKVQRYGSILSGIAKEIKNKMAEDAQEAIENNLFISGKQCANVERSIDNETHEEETDPKVKEEYVPFKWNIVN